MPTEQSCCTCLYLARLCCSRGFGESHPEDFPRCYVITTLTYMCASRDELQRGRLRRVSPDGAQREVAVQQLTARVSIARRRMLLHAGIENWHQSTDTQRVDFMVGVHGQSDHVRRAPGRDVHQGGGLSALNALLMLVLMSVDLCRPSRTP